MRVRHRWILGLSLLILPLLGFADPPSRVGRISHLEGAVSFAPEPPGNDNWSAAQPNYPLTAGNRLYTDAGARAELHVGPSAVRLSEKTYAEFSRFDDQQVEIYLSQGELHVNLRELDRDDHFRVTTPTSSITFTQPGRYRVEVQDNGELSAITVRQGGAEVAAGNSNFTVLADQRAEVRGAQSLSYDVNRAGEEGPLERWAMERERKQEQMASARYVSPTVPGLYELDGHGDWHEARDYGPVWVPRAVAPGWAPYRFGHWAWVHPWGWTWVDDAPWGFAPFHYGRWVYVDDYWAWSPGRVVVRPVYAPALVAFIGAPGLSVSVGIGSHCGWVPLGPREVFVPYYQASHDHIRNVNITNVNVTNINVTNINTTNVNYVNRQAPGGVTFVQQNVMTSSQPIARAIVPVQQSQMRDVVRATPPAQQPVALNNAAPNVPKPSESAIRRRIVQPAQPGAPAVGANPIIQPQNPVDPRQRVPQPAPAHQGEPPKSAAPVATPPDQSDRRRIVAPNPPAHPEPSPGGENKPPAPPSNAAIPRPIPVPPVRHEPSPGGEIKRPEPPANVAIPRPVPAPPVRIEPGRPQVPEHGRPPVQIVRPVQPQPNDENHSAPNVRRVVPPEIARPVVPQRPEPPNVEHRVIPAPPAARPPARDDEARAGAPAPALQHAPPHPPRDERAQPVPPRPRQGPPEQGQGTQDEQARKRRIQVDPNNQ